MEGRGVGEKKVESRDWEKKALGSGHDKLCAWIPTLYRDSNHIADPGIKEMSEWVLTATLSDCGGGGSVEVSVTATLMVSAYLDAQGVIDISSLILIHRMS